MKKRIFITFGDKRFKKARKYCALSARMFGGFDMIITYSPEDIENDFRTKYKQIFEFNRGYGLWLWKPYFIYKTMKEVANEGDMLFYCDAGSIVFRNISYIENAMGNADYWVSSLPLVEWQFTKTDAFKILGCNTPEYKDSPQIQGGFIYLRKSWKSMEFIKEWLDCCCNIYLLHPKNILSGNSNPEGFRAHREDQSILSLLCKKHGILAHQDPTQYSRYPECYYLFNHAIQYNKRDVRQEYPVSIILHRSPNCSFVTLFKAIIFLVIPRAWGKRYLFWKASRM